MTLHDNNGDDNNNNGPLSGHSSYFTLPMSGAPSSLPGWGNLPLQRGPSVRTPALSPLQPAPCHVRELPGAAVTNDGTLWGFKQQKRVLSQAWRPEV